MVTDGSALIEVKVDSSFPVKDVAVLANNVDVTKDFLSAKGSQLIGLVKNLKIGANEIVVKAGGERKLTLLNFDKNGPVISGPHQFPWICTTSSQLLPDGTKLGPPKDENCNADTSVQFAYMPKGGTNYKPLPSVKEVPSDISTTTTSKGKTVNYIVRIETGTVNRAIYQSVVLFDPTVESPPSPTTSYIGWNQKIVYQFGGSMAAGYNQGTITLNKPTDLKAVIALGYAVLGSSLNIFGNNGNDVLSAETASMVKERFVKTFGAPIYTIGWGTSGGSMQQHLIANNYPGILDGITPGRSFSDGITLMYSFMDLALIEKAINTGSIPWTEAQHTAVTGFFGYKVADNFPYYKRGWLLPTPTEFPAVPVGIENFDINNCKSSVVAKQLLYDAASNPKGARCDFYSNQVNLIGYDQSTGLPARGWDNVGVQYGLRALRNGSISLDQFVQLNELAGGYDGDGNLQSNRTAGNVNALGNIYEHGRVNGATNLGSIPIIDYRNYLDQATDIHDSFRSLTTRARLIRSNGNASNQVILRSSSGVDITNFVLQKMDQWVMAIRADTKAHVSQNQKVAANKPSDLKDACYLPGGAKVEEVADINNSGQCGALMPYYSSPRMVAGGPLTDDVQKCQLRPLARQEYVGISDAQFARLSSVFSSGVCDYDKPSVGAKPLKGTWLKYSSAGQAVPLN